MVRIAAFMKRISLDHALIIAIALGFAVAVSFWSGGLDAFNLFSRTPLQNSERPAWTFLVSIPLSWLGWPLSWQVITFFSILLTAVCAIVWGNRRWWIPVFSAAMLWNIWLGQMELFPMAGLMLGGLVLQKRVKPIWLGLAWLALLYKPQIGIGALLAITWWVWRDQGWKALLWAFASSLPIIALTLILWPGWPARWVGFMQATPAVQTHIASIWPYGLLTIPIALIPRNITRTRRLRMILSATLLAAPYFRLYHAAALLTVTPWPWALVLSWLLIFPLSLLPIDWQTLAWILPAAVLLVDLVFAMKNYSQD